MRSLSMDLVPSKVLFRETIRSRSIDLVLSLVLECFSERSSVVVSVDGERLLEIILSEDRPLVMLSDAIGPSTNWKSVANWAIMSRTFLGTR